MKRKLTIKYDKPEREMEEELGEVLRRHGWHFWTSGTDLTSGERDIGYEKEMRGV
jgi:hypothetical protein